MDRIHIDELLCYFGNGSTMPIHALANNERYIVKLFNNPEGNKVLINELVCYHIARQLELPIPEVCFGIVDGNTKVDTAILNSEDFSEACYGLAYCSKFLENAATITSSKMIKASSNYKWLIPKLMLFDHLIYNADRNKGNLLISLVKNNKSLYVIDNSHVFNLEAIWTSRDLKQKISDNDFEDTKIMDDNTYLYPKFKECCIIDISIMLDTIEYFKQKLSKEFFLQLIDKIPDMWENDKGELLGLIEYIIYRYEHIDDYAHLIINTIY